VTLEGINTIPAVFHRNCVRFKERPYAAYRKEGSYVDISWGEMGKMVRNLSCYLLARGIEKGDKVAIFSPNRYEWHMAALAITSIGAVDVPIYATNSSQEAEYILVNSDSKLCFVGCSEQLERVLAVRERLPLVEEFILFDDQDAGVEGVKTLQQALKEGEAVSREEELLSRLESLQPGDLSTIIYTSGTTGDPKGVMLTHGNLYSNVVNTLHGMHDRKTGEFLLSEKDIFLSFLPLSHSFERTTGFHGAVYLGAKTAFATSIQTVMEDFVAVRPTIIICVPRIYEKIHAAILSKLGSASAVRKMMFAFAMKQADKNLHKICLDQEITSPAYKLADKLVFSKLKAVLGMDRLRYAISGGAPLSVSDAEFFIGMGFKILEGYGLTETAPIISYNRYWHIKPGTVGQPIKDTQCKISEEGELLVKGPQVMLGYYKNEAATREAFTEDGFLKTEDMATIDADGFITITGRLKDIVVTSGGKNISPQNIENSVKASLYVEQIAVIGDRRNYLTALIVPAFPELEAWAKNMGIAYNTIDELLQHPKVLELYQKEIDERTAQFGRVEKIKKFTLVNAEWTQETGELTPSLKIKRRVVEKKYAHLIEAMYSMDKTG